PSCLFVKSLGATPVGPVLEQGECPGQGGAGTRNLLPGRPSQGERSPRNNQGDDASQPSRRQRHGNSPPIRELLGAIEFQNHRSAELAPRRASGAERSAKLAGPPARTLNPDKPRWRSRSASAVVSARDDILANPALLGRPGGPLPVVVITAIDV